MSGPIHLNGQIGAELAYCLGLLRDASIGTTSPTTFRRNRYRP